MDEAVAVIMALGALVVALVVLDTGGSRASANYRIETFAAEAAAAAAAEVSDEPPPQAGDEPGRWSEIAAAYERSAAVAAAGLCTPAEGDWATIELVDTQSGGPQPWAVVAAVRCRPSTALFGRSGPIGAVGVATVRWSP